MIRLLLFLLFFAPASALAHTVENDGVIGATLHVDPSDDPVATEPSGFYFDFKDTGGKFRIDDCLCTAVIRKGNQELFTQQLTKAGAQTASFAYAFPEKGEYLVRLIGVPLRNGDFKPFDLSFKMNVRREPTPTPSPSPEPGAVSAEGINEGGWAVPGALALLALALVAAATWKRRTTLQHKPASDTKRGRR
jgi:hypothetical protein